MTSESIAHRSRLLDAMLSLTADLSLPAVLERVVAIAVEVTGARYGALGVLGADGAIDDFVTVGIDAATRARIGDIPRGRGVLGVLIHDPRPLRLRDITEHPDSSGFPPHHPRMRSFIGLPVTVRSEVVGNLYLTEKAGGAEFTEEDEAALALLAGQAGVAIGNARLYEAARSRGRRLEAAREIVTAILEGGDAGAATALVAARARELLAADIATVVRRRSGQDLEIVAADGEGAAALTGMHVPARESLSGRVIATGTPVVIDDARSTSDAYQPMVEAGQMGPAVFVPLSAAGDRFGTLAVARELGAARFNDADVRLLETFADQAALALEYGHAQQQRRRVAVVEDRERIARDLHDGVIQSLYAVGMGLQSTAQRLVDSEAVSRLEEAVTAIDRVISDLRGYIFGLRPTALQGVTLAQAIEEIAGETERGAGIVVAVDVDPAAEALITSLSDDVLHVVREALSNAHRHGGATTARVSLRLDADAVLLEVDDDGSGYDTSVPSRGMGLRNLRLRAERMGGTLELASAIGEGTTVRLRIPVTTAPGDA